MLYRTAAIAGLVGLCLSATCVGASDAANHDDNTKKRKRFGRQGIFGKVFSGNEADDGGILAEDEGYWERFLQESASIVTPAPTVETNDCVTAVSITCVDSAGNDCASTPPPLNPEECIEPFKYTFTVENIGPVCMTLTAWTATYSVTTDGQTTTTPFDLLPTVPVEDREICPGETLAIMDTVDTDLCAGSKYAFTTNVEANPPNGNACEAEDMYMVQTVPPEIPCDVSIELTCVNGDGTNCDEIQNPQECVQDLTYTYCIDNPGSTCMEVTSFERTITPPGTSGSIINLLQEQFGSTTICPEDTANGCIEITETVPSVNVCTAGKVTTTTTITAAPPFGDACNAEAMYMFTVVTPAPTPNPTPEPTLEPTFPPTLPPLEPCDVVVRTECSTQAATIGGSGECDAIIPIITRCDSRATFMEMLFNGGDCSQSFNIQEADKFDCEDRNGGPALSGQYYIHVAPRKDPSGDVYFSGLANVGDVFPMCPGFPSCSGDRFEADSTVWVFPTDVASDPNFDPVTNPNYVQLVNYHTSCSQNLFLKDKFGSTQLVIFFNDEQGLVSCFLTATFSITLTNEGESSADEIILFTNTVNGNTTDLTSAVNEIGPGEIIIITTQILIDMTVRQDYIVTTDFVGATAEGLECSDSFTFQFTAGNNLDAPPGIVFPGLPESF